MSFNVQAQIKQNATDIRNYIDDLYKWEDEIVSKGGKKKSEPKKGKASVESFPIRGKVEIEPSKSTSSDKTKEPVPRESLEESDPEKNKYKRDQNTIGSYYKAWDKFNVDDELKKLNEGEEEVKSGQSTDSKAEPNGAKVMAKPNTKIIVKGGRNKFIETNALKEKGNLFYQSKEFDKAIEMYSQSLETLPRDGDENEEQKEIKEYAKAEGDCNKALGLKPDHLKSLSRRATARRKLGHMKLALSDLKKALALDSENKELLADLKLVESKLKTQKENANKKLILPVARTKPDMIRIEVDDIGENQLKQKNKKGFMEFKKEEPRAKPAGFKDKDAEKENIGTEPSGAAASEILRFEKSQEPSYDYLNLKLIDKKASTINGESWPGAEENRDRKIKFSGAEIQGILTIKPLNLKAQPGKSILKTSKTEEKGAGDQKQVVEKSSDAVVNIESVIDIGKKQKIEQIREELEKKTEERKIASSSQFESFWKNLGEDVPVISAFFKSIEPKSLANIFREGIDIDLLVQIFNKLGKIIESNEQTVKEFVLEIPKIKRFDINIKCLLKKEKQGISLILQELKKKELIEESVFKELLKVYGVQI